MPSPANLPVEEAPDTTDATAMLLGSGLKNRGGLRAIKVRVEGTWHHLFKAKGAKKKSGPCDAPSRKWTKSPLSGLVS